MTNRGAPTEWTPDEDRALRLAWETWTGYQREFDEAYADTGLRTRDMIEHRRRKLGLTAASRTVVIRGEPVPIIRSSVDVNGVSDDPGGVRAQTRLLDRALRHVAAERGFKLAAWA